MNLYRMNAQQGKVIERDQNETKNEDVRKGQAKAMNEGQM